MTNRAETNTGLATRIFDQTIVFKECFTCGIPIAMTVFQKRQFDEQGMTIQCVLGHGTMRRESEVQRLQRELKDTQDRLTQAETEKQSAERVVDAAIKKRQRLEKRVGAGVCLHCHRSFQNVRRHMDSQHGKTAVP